MNQEEENRYRRNYVSNMYPGAGWKERVAHMSTDRITAIYLRFIRDDQKPKSEDPTTEMDIQEEEKEDDDDDEQFRLF